MVLFLASANAQHGYDMSQHQQLFQPHEVQWEANSRFHKIEQ